MLFEGPISSKPFIRWIRTDRENRLLLRLAVIAIIVQFMVFKFLYPFPNFMPPDSYSYLEAASKNQSINIWAIGYSKFLRLFSSFTNSHVVLVWFQYFLLEASLLGFLFSVRYLFSTGKWLFRILAVITILNPLVPHISNFVGSDTIFTALSLIWFTQLLWILFKPNLRLVLWHALVLLLAFMVRYNSLYYPLISIIIIVGSRLQMKVRWMGVGAIVILLGGFITNTEFAYHRITNTWQYSAFGGWQIAANALYGYAHAVPEAPERIPREFRKLHTMVNDHMKSLHRIPFFLRPDHDVSVYYLWDFNSPLKTYMDEQWKTDTIGSYFKHWGSMGSLYAAYGRYLIWHHPIPFIKFYIWPNLVKYYSPPVGFMGYYALGNNQVDPIAVDWFGWKSNKISTRFKNSEISVTQPFPVLVAMANLLFVFSFLGFGILGGFRKATKYSKQVLWWVFAIWLGNMVFSVISAPIELRYQLFPIIITLSFLSLFLSFLIQASRSVDKKMQLTQGIPALLIQ